VAQLFSVGISFLSPQYRQHMLSILCCHSAKSLKALKEALAPNSGLVPSFLHPPSNSRGKVYISPFTPGLRCQYATLKHQDTTKYTVTITHQLPTRTEDIPSSIDFCRLQS